MSTYFTYYDTPKCEHEKCAPPKYEQQNEKRTDKQNRLQ